MQGRPGKTVVSVTPIAVGRDSRTFKQAASIARMGMRSVVVELEASPPSMGEGSFELVTLPGASYNSKPAPAGAGSTVMRRPPTTSSPPAAGARAQELNLAGRARVGLARGLEPLLSPAAVLRVNQALSGAIPAGDLYVVHSWGRLPAAWSAARRHGAPLIYDAHDSYLESYPDGEGPYASALTRRVLAAMEREFALRAAGFLTVSDGVAGLLERRIGRRPEVIVNYPDTRLDRDGAGDVRTAIGAAPADFVLVSVGNDKAGMDVLASIDATAMLPERFRLVLIGGGMSAYEGAVRDRGLEGRVHLLTPLPPDRINRFIRTADAGVILYYGITRNFEFAVPNRLFHAVAAGLPLLFPDLPGIGGIAREHGLGLPIDSRNPESIATAARTLAGDASLMARLGESAQRARERLTWEQQEPLLEEAISRAFDDGRPGRPGTRGRRP